MGFSRQEHWSGLPVSIFHFTVSIGQKFRHKLDESSVQDSYVVVVYTCSVVSDSVTPWTVACQAPLCPWIFQVRILQRVAISSSRGASGPRDQTCVSHVSCIAGRFFTSEPLQDCTGCNLGVRWVAISSEAMESSFKLML